MCRYIAPIQLTALMLQSEPKTPPKIRKRGKKWAESVIWEDTEETSAMYSLIEANDLDHLNQWLNADPDVVHIRSQQHNICS